ncbi:hypothetical protein WN51_14487 [Melipona quadrifasciata]|uniref:Uncharacterized protein n=1 Tax=Melipona quadrifasciata TaxID=166423 RepID=A0A0N0BFQ6_9HYME|nr:hypothetical protein WN51_14487 [Melipona quadrifasciata]
MKTITKIAEDAPMSRKGNATELNTPALIDRQASTSDPIPSKFCTVSVVSCFRNVSDFHIKRAGKSSQSSSQSHRPFAKMQLNACFVFLLLGLSLSRAIPAEKKEEAKKELEKKEPEIEQTGEDIDRSKKSVFVMDQLSGVPRTQSFGISETINIQNPQPVQTLSIKGPQSAQTLNIKPVPGVSETISIQGPQPVQTLSIKPASGPSETIRIQGLPSFANVQTFNIQPSSQGVQTLSIQGQPLQTFSVKPGSQVQSFSIQSGQSANVIMGPHDAKTVQVIHPGQGGSQTNVNIVQPSVKKEIDVPVVEKITRTEKIVEPGVVVSEVEKEIVSPVTPVFREQLTLDPQCSCFVLAEPEAVAAFFKYPQLRFGKQKIFCCAVKPKVLVEQPVRVLEVMERALVSA